MKKTTLFLLSAIVILSGSCSTAARAATWYLQNGATGNWNTLTNWNSQPLGGGTNPTSISSTDNFDLNGFGVDTPSLSSGTTTFGGNELIMHGGSAGIIVTKTTPPAVIAIPTVVSYGGEFLCAIPGTIAIDITTLTNNSNTTFNGNGSNLGLNLTIGTLSGPGDICAIGAGSGSAGGIVLFDVTTATAFTGTLHIADGCKFTFENGMTSGGALEVEGAGTSVTLNTTVTFKGLTINGTVKAPGTYTASSLGAPFTGTGSVVVQTAAVQSYTVTQPFGVNLPGGSFSSGPAYPTDPNEWSYYQGKKLNLVRVAFLWEQVQPTLNGPLSTSALASLDAAVSLAAADGMQVILDMHNYDQRTVSGTSYYIGSSEVPYSAYQNAWQQLAAHYVGEPGIFGYDIMNEPNGDGGTWNSTAAQDGVNGVRQSDTTHYVIVEGDNYAGAQAWMANNQTLNVTDSADKLIYSAHTYWDSNDSGVYDGTYDSNNDYPNIGVDRVASFLYWLSLKGAQGYVGEFGVPNNVSSPDYRWNEVLDNFLYDLNNNGVAGTYWSGGECWGTSYALSCATGTPPVDAPAMAALENYGSASGITVVNVPNDSFETPATSSYIYNPAGADWTFTGNSGIQENGSLWGGANAPDGTQTAFLQGNPKQGTGVLGAMSQSISFPATGTYAVNFEGAKRNTQTQPIQISIDGTVVETYTPSSDSFIYTTTPAFNVSAGAHTLAFAATNNSSDNSTFIDMVSIQSAIPTVANDSFETPSTASYIYNPTGGNWTFTGNSGVQVNGSLWGGANAPNGIQTAFLQGDGTLGSISQNINFPASGTFAVSFEAAKRNTQTQPIKVSIDGTVVGTYTPASSSFASITSASFAVTAGVHTLTFAATNNSGDNSSFIDSVSIVAP